MSNTPPPLPEGIDEPAVVAAVMAHTGARTVDQARTHVPRAEWDDIRRGIAAYIAAAPRAATPPPLPEGHDACEREALRLVAKEGEAQLALIAERDALARFKAYVHKRLDDAGVPVDPPSPHREKGCRIGGRLDWLLSHVFATVEAVTPAAPPEVQDYERGFRAAIEAAAAGVERTPFGVNHQRIAESIRALATTPPLPEGQDVANPPTR